MPKRLEIESRLRGRSDSGLVGLWWFSLAAAGVVVGVVAALLGLIVAAAKQIDQHAAGIWTVGKQIAGNTVSIWMLEKTNEQVASLADSVRSLERSAASIDEQLSTLARASGQQD